MDNKKHKKEILLYRSLVKIIIENLDKFYKDNKELEQEKKEFKNLDYKVHNSKMFLICILNMWLSKNKENSDEIIIILKKLEFKNLGKLLTNQT